MVAQLVVLEFAAGLLFGYGHVQVPQVIQVPLQVHEVLVFGVELLVEEVVLLVLVVFEAFFLEELELQRVVVALDGVVDSLQVLNFGFQPLDVQVRVIQLPLERIYLVVLAGVLVPEVGDRVVVFVDFLVEHDPFLLAVLDVAVLVLDDVRQLLVVGEQFVDFVDLADFDIR